MGDSLSTGPAMRTGGVGKSGVFTVCVETEGEYVQWQGAIESAIHIFREIQELNNQQANQEGEQVN